MGESVSLAEVLHCPLVEEVVINDAGWDKASIQWAISNRDRLISLLQKLADSSKQAITYYDVEDIYEQLLLQLYRSNDYDIGIAQERSKTGEIVTIEAYVCFQAKCCFNRFSSDTYKITKNIVKDFVNTDDEDKDLSPLDLCSDERNESEFEDLLYDIEESCQQYQAYRYILGVDIYELLYMRLISYNCKTKNPNEFFNELLDIKGITPRELQTISTNKDDIDEDILPTLLKSIKVAGLEKATQILEKYVYCANSYKSYAYSI